MADRLPGSESERTFSSRSRRTATRKRTPPEVTEQPPAKRTRQRTATAPAAVSQPESADRGSSDSVTEVNHQTPAFVGRKRKASEPLPAASSSGQPFVARRSARIANRLSSTGSSGEVSPVSSEAASQQNSPRSTAPSSSRRSCNSKQPVSEQLPGVRTRHQHSLSVHSVSEVNNWSSPNRLIESSAGSNTRLPSAGAGSADSSRSSQRISGHLRGHSASSSSPSRPFAVSSSIFVPPHLPRSSVSGDLLSASNSTASSSSLPGLSTRSYHLRGSAASSSGSSLPFAAPSSLTPWSILPGFNLGNSNSSAPAGGPATTSGDSSRRGSLLQAPTVSRRSLRGQRAVAAELSAVEGGDSSSAANDGASGSGRRPSKRKFVRGRAAAAAAAEAGASESSVAAQASSASASGMAAASSSSAGAEAAEDWGAMPSMAPGGELGGPSDLPDDLQRLQTLLELKGLPSHVFTRMQQILQQSSAGGAKANQILQGLQAADDENTQLQALMELCQMLVMGNEDTLVGFPFKQVVPALIHLLSMEHNLDMMVQAARALFYMMEALPRSTSCVAEAIPTFVEKLRAIRCMDVAEQSLSALEVLSKQHSRAIVQAGGLSSCLLFLDFFSTSAQRSALAVAANCCYNVSVSDQRLVVDAIPILSEKLKDTDKKSLESACLCFARLADNFISDPSLLEQLASHGLLPNLQQLLVVSPMVISNSTFVMVLLMMSSLCAHCPQLTVQLIEKFMPGTLRYLLVGSEKEEGQPIEIMSRGPNELHAILSLVAELLPRLPKDGVFSYLSRETLAAQAIWQWQDNSGQWRSYGKSDSNLIEAARNTGVEEFSITIAGRPYIIDLQNMQQVNEDTGSSRTVKRTAAPPTSAVAPEEESSKADPRMVHFEARPNHLVDLSTTLLPVLFEVHKCTAGPAIRQKCLLAVLRLVHAAPADLLKDCLQDLPISSLIAQLLSSTNSRVVVIALLMAESLMTKLPDIFHIYFRREGVMHEVGKLSKKPPARQASTAAASTATPGSTVTNGAAGQSSSSAKSSPALSSKPSSSSLTTRSPPRTRRRTASIRTPGQTLTASAQKRSTQLPSPFTTPEYNTPTGRRLSDVFRGNRRSARHQQRAASNESMSVDDLLASGSSSDLSLAAAVTSSQATPTSNPGESLLCSTGSLGSNASLDSLGRRTPMREGQEKIQLWIHQQAKQFFSSHFEDSGSGHPALTVLNSLTDAVNRLSVQDNNSIQTLQDIKDVLCNMDSRVSAFEVLHSGLVERLMLFLSSTAPDTTDIADRWRHFLHVFLGCPSSHAACVAAPDLGNGTPPFVYLLQRLHGCVTQLEQFVVKVHDLPGTGASCSGRGPHMLRMINSHHLKCQLRRHPDVRNVSQWKKGLVRIDPLASIQAIERYLVVRGFGRVRQPADSSPNESDDGTDDEIDESMAAAFQGSNPARHYLEFMIGSQVIPYNITIYNAIKLARQQQLSEDDGGEEDMFTDVWSSIHTIYYRPVRTPAEDEASGSASASASASSTSLSTSGGSPATLSATPEGASRGKGRRGGGSVSKSKRKGKAAEPNTHRHSTSSLTPPEPKTLLSAAMAPPPSSASKDGVKAFSPLHSIVSKPLGKVFVVQDPSVPVLSLLRVLHALNVHWASLYQAPVHSDPIISTMEFVNGKLGAKAMRQLQDAVAVMTGQFPDWLVQLAKACPFLLPFECRQQLFHFSVFDRDRAFQRLQEMMPELTNTDHGGDRDRVMPRLEKKKLSVARDDLFGQLEDVLNSVKNSRAILEVQFTGEVGTGLGPTLEFYTLMSREFQRADLNMWRGQPASDDTPYVHSTGGLFPMAKESTDQTPCLRHFHLLGRFVAKALYDSRMVDLPLSVAFSKWILNQQSLLGIQDIHSVDQDMARSVGQLQRLLLNREQLSTVEDRDTRENSTKRLSEQVEELTLDFRLPGTSIELKEGGSNISVTLDNLDEYLQLLSQSMLVKGVQQQMTSFNEGFNSVFNISHLNMFCPEELMQLFCGSQHDPWDMKSLMEHCRPDHGYTHDSRAVRYLFEILTSFGPSEQRKFLMFVTGSPRLPIGGFRAMHPPLTIVQKSVESQHSPNDYLPSVMTCVNYLKLPDYSSRAIMEERLLKAMSEGQNAFHLS